MTYFMAICKTKLQNCTRKSIKNSDRPLAALCNIKKYYFYDFKFSIIKFKLKQTHLKLWSYFEDLKIPFSKVQYQKFYDCENSNKILNSSLIHNDFQETPFFNGPEIVEMKGNRTKFEYVTKCVNTQLALQIDKSDS